MPYTKEQLKNNENYEKNMKIAWSRKQFPTR